MDFSIDRSQNDEAKASSSDEKMPSGAKYQTLVDGVDKELTCAICLSRYNNPKVLPCLHSYCKSCLEGLLKSPLTKQEAGLFTEKAPHLQETRWLTCPQCKETHEVPPQGIDSFKTYFTINNLLELLHIHEVSSGNGGGVGDTVVKCESGLDENTAYARCLTCAEYICEKCFTIHKRLKVTKDHNVVTLEKIKQSDKKLGVKSVQQRQYCDEHEDEVLKLFCKTCEKVICRDCALVKHRGHNYLFIREVRPETQKQLEALQKEVETKEKEFQSHKKYIGDLQKQNEDALSECLKEVNGACDKLIEAVESRRAALIVDVHEVHEAEEAKRKEELNTIDLSLVRLSDSVRFTRNLLDSSDDVEMMTVGLQAMSTLKGLRKMTWDKEKVKPNLMRLKFSPLTDKIKTHGNVVNTIEASDLSVENFPHHAYIYEEVKFTVKLSDEISKRKYDASSILSVKVNTRSNRGYEKPVEVKVERTGLNKWTVSATPTVTKQHTVEVKIGQFVTKSLWFTVGMKPPTKEEKSVPSESTVEFKADCSFGSLYTPKQDKAETQNHNSTDDTAMKMDNCKPEVDLVKKMPPESIVAHFASKADWPSVPCGPMYTAKEEKSEAETQDPTCTDNTNTQMVQRGVDWEKYKPPESAVKSNADRQSVTVPYRPMYTKKKKNRKLKYKILLVRIIQTPKWSSVGWTGRSTSRQSLL